MAALTFVQMRIIDNKMELFWCVALGLDGKPVVQNVPIGSRLLPKSRRATRGFMITYSGICGSLRCTPTIAF